MWHIDTTVIRLLDGTRAYLHAVIDNFSRRILAWRVADTFRTSEQRGCTARGESGRDSFCEDPSRVGGRGRGER
jgi:transposase InsO family protein